MTTQQKSATRYWATLPNGYELSVRATFRGAPVKQHSKAWQVYSGGVNVLVERLYPSNTVSSPLGGIQVMETVACLKMVMTKENYLTYISNLWSGKQTIEI